MDPKRNDDCFYQAMYEDDYVRESQHTTNNVEAFGSVQYSPLIQDKAKRVANFAPEEDIALVNACLNTSMNPSIGADQKGKTFWSKIAKNFFKNYPTLLNERGTFVDQPMGEKIQKAINKFMGIIAQVENSHPSSLVEQDMIQKAKIMYREMYNSNFKFDHCWNILRQYPKWLETNGVAGKRKQNIASSPSTPTLVNVNEDCAHSNSSVDLERPPGKKAMKPKKKKKKKGNGVEEFFDYVDWKSDKLMMRDQKMKLEEKKLMIIKEAEERRAKLEEDKEDMNIKMMNVSGLTEEAKEYIQMQRAKIIEKGRNT